MPATEIQADWAAQRIKNLSLSSAVHERAAPQAQARHDITTLIDEFQYPKYGPGMMWERARDLSSSRAARSCMNAPGHGGMHRRRRRRRR